MLDTPPADAKIGASFGAGMFLDLKDIGSETLSFDGDVPVPETEWYRGESVRFLAGHAAVRVELSEGRIEMTGRLSAKVDLTCGRCLERWTWDFETPVALHLLATESEKGEETGKSVEGVLESEDEWTLDGTALDLGRLCREFVLLNLPLKPVCRPDCKGLCPQCGANRNHGDCDCRATSIDPRLASLLEFKKRLDSD